MPLFLFPITLRHCIYIVKPLWNNNFIFGALQRRNHFSENRESITNRYFHHFKLKYYINFEAKIFVRHNLLKNLSKNLSRINSIFLFQLWKCDFWFWKYNIDELFEIMWLLGMWFYPQEASYGLERFCTQNYF